MVDDDNGDDDGDDNGDDDGLLEINKKSSIRHCAYNICTWRISVMAMGINHLSPFRGQRLFVFTVGCPVTFYCIQKHSLFF